MEVSEVRKIRKWKTHEKAETVVDGDVDDSFLIVAPTCIDQSNAAAVLSLPSKGIAASVDPDDALIPSVRIYGIRNFEET